MRKKLGHLIQSPKDTLDDMLEHHLDEVQALLLKKKSEYEEMNDSSSRTDDGPQTVAKELRSPPIPSSSHTPKQLERGSRQESVNNLLKSPRLPQMGLFSTASSMSPKSPRSPMKRTF
jgi:histone deacetylase 6